MTKITEVENSKIARLLGVHAIMLYPYVLYAKTPNQAIRKHELTHVVQAEREGVCKFYLKYIGYYLWGLVRYMSHKKAYRNIPYEVEARAAERRW